MKQMRIVLVLLGAILACLAEQNARGQQLEPFRRNRGSGNWAQNLRVTAQSADHTEATLVMDVWYDGSAGPTALLEAVVSKKGDKESAKWFSSDRQVIGTGGGMITLKEKFLKSAKGAPEKITTDQVQIRFLNSSGRLLLTTVPFLKTIHWGENDSAEKNGSVQENKALTHRTIK
jgi:hypothetical protein